MITYFIKSGICLALLLAFYHLILEREKMHQFNRFYLLGSVLFSFLAPLYKIYIEVTPQASELFVPMIVDSNTATEIVTSQTQEIDYMLYLAFAYTIIALILLVRFIKNLVSIYLKIKHHQKIKKEKATIILVDDAISPHTFWNYIFINKEEYNSNKIETELYTHELTHALQKHTFDVLLIEFLQVMFWINPTFIFLKKAIKLNHEFLADNKVITIHKNTTEYQYLLLNRAAWNNDYYLASNLNYLLTKKRLLMMTKQSSRTKILLKKLAVIPVLAGFTLLFAERVEAYGNNDELIDSEIIQDELPKEQIANDSSSLEDIKNKLNQANSLKMSFTEKKDTFNIGLANGEQLKVWEDRVIDYNKLNKEYEELRNQKPHYIKSSEERQKQLNDLFSKLGSLYFNLPKTDKTKVKRPVNPHNPYVRLKKDGEVYYKLKSELTKEDKKLLPPPPASNKTKHTPIKSDSIPKLKRIVNGKKGTFTYTTKDGREITKKISELTEEEKKILPPPPSARDFNKKTKTGFTNAQNQTLYYVKNEKGATFYNRWGQEVTKEGKIINPEKTASDKIIEGQNISKVYKDDKVVTEFKRSNLPPPPPKTTFPEVKKGDISNIPPPSRKYSNNSIPPPPPMSAEEMVFRYPKAKYYVNDKKTTYKNVSSFVKNKKGISVVTQEKNGEKIIKFFTPEFLKPMKTPNNSNIIYYLDNKIISKSELDKIIPDKIASVSVKKNKDNSKSIYVVSKK